MPALTSARFALWALLILGTPLSGFGQLTSAPETHQAEARRVLSLAAAPFGPGAPEPLAQRGLLPQIAEAQARAGDLTGARQTVGWTRNAQEKAGALAGLACELARTGRLAEAQAVAEEIAALSRAARESSPSVPDDPRPGGDVVILEHYAEAIGSVVLARALAGDLKGAHATQARLVTVEHRCAALFAIVVARVDAGDVAGAKELLETSEDFRKGFTEARDADRGLIDPATAVAFIQNASQSRSLTTDFRRVLGLCRWMYRLDQVEHFGYLIGMMAKAGRQSQVEQVLAVGARHGSAAPAQVEGFVAGLLWAGDLKTARRAAETFPGEETQSRVRRLVAEALAREGDFTAARQIAEPIKIRSLQAVALATVAALQLKRAPGPDAQRALQQAIAVTDGIRDVPARFLALCRIARAQGAAGDKLAARKSLERALTLARTAAEGPTWDLFAGDLVETYLDIGEHAGALDLVSGASGRKLPPYERITLQSAIGVAFIRAGKRGEADRLFEQALRLAAGEDLLWEVCEVEQAWTHGGGVSQAVAAAERLTTPVQRSFALLGAAKGLLRLANPDFYFEEPVPWPLQAGRFAREERRAARPRWKLLLSRALSATGE